VATGSDDQATSTGRDAGRWAAADLLTPAQAHALSRSAPLTPEQFKAQGRLAGASSRSASCSTSSPADPR